MQSSLLRMCAECAGCVPHKVSEKHVLNGLLHSFSPRPCLKNYAHFKRGTQVKFPCIFFSLDQSATKQKLLIGSSVSPPFFFLKEQHLCNSLQIFFYDL